MAASPTRPARYGTKSGATPARARATLSARRRACVRSAVGPTWRNGRRIGLKIRWGESPVPVRVRRRHQCDILGVRAGFPKSGVQRASNAGQALSGSCSNVGASGVAKAEGDAAGRACCETWERAMSMKTILVPMEPHEGMTAVLETALLLAKKVRELHRGLPAALRHQRVCRGRPGGLDPAGVLSPGRPRGGGAGPQAFGVGRTAATNIPRASRRGWRRAHRAAGWKTLPKARA